MISNVSCPLFNGPNKWVNMQSKMHYVLNCESWCRTKARRNLNVRGPTGRKRKSGKFIPTKSNWQAQGVVQSSFIEANQDDPIKMTKWEDCKRYVFLHWIWPKMTTLNIFYRLKGGASHPLTVVTFTVVFFGCTQC